MILKMGVEAIMEMVTMTMGMAKIAVDILASLSAGRTADAAVTVAKATVVMIESVMVFRPLFIQSL